MPTKAEVNAKIVEQLQSLIADCKRFKMHTMAGRLEAGIPALAELDGAEEDKYESQHRAYVAGYKRGAQEAQSPDVF